MRRCSGIWPPSNPPATGPRALLPLVPRPAVLPLPASPRPTRVRGVCAPGAGRRWWIFSPRPAAALPPSAISVDLLDGDQVAHRLDHAAYLRPVRLHDDVADPPQTQRAQRLPLHPGAADLRLDLGNPQLAHVCSPAPAPAAAVAAAAARALSMAAGATCSIGRPRRAAISSGRFRLFSAATVAWITLIGLDEPRDRDSTSWMPAHSSTARTGPPAMTPVPGLAGLSRTTPAASSPCTACGIVPPILGTRKKPFLAASTPLAIAAGTSLALP